MIYLDYTANTPADPAVLEAFLRTEQNYIGNPNSNHPAGQEAREEMARVTDSIAAMLGVSPAEIIYTSGASESNNLALKGVAQASRHMGRHIISTALEHSSVGLPVLLMMTQLFDAGCTLINSCGDTVASMLVTRVLYGKDWHKKNLNQTVAEEPETVSQAPSGK